MRVYAIHLPGSYCFACSRKDIVRFFGQEKLDWVSFGAVRRHFSFDSRCFHRPKFSGPVVAALTFSPHGAPYLSLYPILQAAYGDTARNAFIQSVLPHLSRRLEEMQARPETAPAKYEQIIVEWTGTEHRYHQVKFL